MSVPRLQALHLPRLWNRAEDLNSPEPESGKGFDNPMFDVVSGPAGGMGVLSGGFLPFPTHCFSFFAAGAARCWQCRGDTAGNGF